MERRELWRGLKKRKVLGGRGEERKAVWEEDASLKGVGWDA